MSRKTRPARVLGNRPAEQRPLQQIAQEDDARARWTQAVNESGVYRVAWWRRALAWLLGARGA